MNFIQRILHRPFFIRLFHWEYWGFVAVYAWIYPVWLFYCLRSGSFFFFAAANPRIKNGGFLNESKRDIAALIPIADQPKTAFFSEQATVAEVLQELKAKGLAYPLIGKPDVGGRGRGIKALPDEATLKQYLAHVNMDFHIQEYVPYKQEVGIFYYRLPGAESGKVTGIVRKEFLSVTGDGRQSIRQLLNASKRALMYLPALERMHGAVLEEILPAGEKRIVSPYGNHARGSLFIDDSHLITEELEQRVELICRAIPEFYFGRLDIRFQDWDTFLAGKQFSIIEVNGAGAEPTHIYDPAHSLFFAWKEIIRHWTILYRVSSRNHKNGAAYLSFAEGLAMFREDKEWSRKLAAMPE